jgi:hypothetical protein
MMNAKTEVQEVSSLPMSTTRTLFTLHPDFCETMTEARSLGDDSPPYYYLQ